MLVAGSPLLAMGMQGATNPSTIGTNGQYGLSDVSYYASLFNWPACSAPQSVLGVSRTFASILTMADGIGTQGTWADFDGSAYTSAQDATTGPWSATSTQAVATPGANAIFPSIPLGALPPGDPTAPTLAQAGGGTFNSHYTNAANQFVSTNFPIAFWRLMWEFTGSWYPWGYGAPGQDQANYAKNFVATWKQMAATVLPVVPGGLIWNLNNDFLTSCPVWQDCYPGDTGFGKPVVGTDAYDNAWPDNNPANAMAYWNQYTLPGLQAASQFAQSVGAQFAVPEWGAGTNGDNPAFVQLMLEFLAGLPTGLLSYHGYYSVGDTNLLSYPLTWNALIQGLSLPMSAPA